MQVAEDMTRTDIQDKFTKMYPSGWARIIKLAKNNPGAVTLYAFFAEHIDHTCGAVVADQAFLAAKMNCSVRTIQRWLDYLEKEQALVRIPVAGKVCAYALDSDEVWKGQNSTRGYAAFTAKTLVNMDGEVQRRIQAMLSSR